MGLCIYWLSMINMTRILLTIFLLLSCSGCKWFTNAGSPFLSGSSFKIPEGTPTFQSAFKDGCNTVLYARGNIFYRTFHKHNYNAKLIGNPEYRFGYGRGYSYCFMMVNNPVSGPTTSFDRAFNPYGYDETFNAGNVNNAWGGFFLGGTMGGDLTNSTGNGLDGTFDVLQKSVAGMKGGSGNKTVFGTIFWEGGSSCQFFGQSDC